MLRRWSKPALGLVYSLGRIDSGEFVTVLVGHVWRSLCLGGIVFYSNKLVLNAMKNNPIENLLNVECVLTLDTLMNARHVTNYVSEQHGFKLIAHVLYGIIGFELTSPAKIHISTTFSHDCQSKFVQASFSILSRLPPRYASTNFQI